jgi:hypothetical protein
MCGWLDVRGMGVGADSPKLVECQCLIPALLVPPGQVQCLACVLPRLVVASRQETDLAEPRDTLGMSGQPARADILPERIFQEDDSLGDASRECICMA